MLHARSHATATTESTRAGSVRYSEPIRLRAALSNRALLHQPPDLATAEWAGRVAATQVRLWRVGRNVPGVPEDGTATLRGWDGVSGCAQMCMRSSARSIPNKGSRSWKN